MDKDNKFTLESTNVAKGVAIGIMLFHHLFAKSDLWDLFYHRFSIRSWPLISYLASQGKICVTIFVFLSAYGLTLTYQKKVEQKKLIDESMWGGHYVKLNAVFILERIKKLYVLYWPIFIPGLLIGWITGLRVPSEIYSSIGEGIRDFFGIAYFIDGETPFNGAWWYISFAITLYLLFPLFRYGMEKIPKILLIVSLLFGVTEIIHIAFFVEWRRYLFVVFLGIFIADKDLINKILQKYSQSRRIVMSIVSCMILLLVRCIHPYTFDGFLALAIILFSVSLFEKAGKLKILVGFFGKHSGNMFLLHGLIYRYYLQSFIYSFWFPPIIWAVLMIISLGVSVVVEIAKKGCMCGIRYIAARVK